MDYEAPSGDETLLLVEDEPMLRELGSTVLTECGYRVITAENGVDALRIFGELSSGAIDLVITDVVMPEMGGKELMENLRTVAPGTKVIFCSGYAEDAIFHGGALDTGVCFLQKPYTIAGIARKVREVLAAK